MSIADSDELDGLGTLLPARAGDAEVTRTG
jgi:hypothetical protein